MRPLQEATRNGRPSPASQTAAVRSELVSNGVCHLDASAGGGFGVNVVRAFSKRRGHERVVAGGTRVRAQLSRDRDAERVGIHDGYHRTHDAAPAPSGVSRHLPARARSAASARGARR